MELGEKLKSRRLQLGLTIQEVAEYVNVSKPTVQRYETGEIKNLKQEVVERLSQILKVSPGYLLGWVDDMGNPTMEYIEKKSFVSDLLEMMIRNKMIQDVENIDEKTMKMIIEAVKLEAEHMLKGRD